MSTQDKQIGSIRYAAVCDDCDRTVERRLRSTTEHIHDKSEKRVRCKECGGIVRCQKKG